MIANIFAFSKNYPNNFLFPVPVVYFIYPPQNKWNKHASVGGHWVEVHSIPGCTAPDRLGVTVASTGVLTIGTHWVLTHPLI